MSNWSLKLPFHWTIRGGWCTRDRVGGANYSTGGFRDAIRTQRKSKDWDPWDSQVVTYSLIVERHYDESGWARRWWQKEYTFNYLPRLSVRSHMHKHSVLYSTWLSDDGKFWPDANKRPEPKQKTLADWEKEMDA